MFKYLLIALVMCGQVACTTGSKISESLKSATSQPSDTVIYDSMYASRMGADEYGMKSYVFAYLKVGPNRGQDSAEVAQIQRAHLDNITRLANQGKLVMAGPFLDNGPVRGIYIFNVETVEEARALTETDPAIRKGRLVMDLHPWYGSAALCDLNNWHKKVAKKPI